MKLQTSFNDYKTAFQYKFKITIHALINVRVNRYMISARVMCVISYLITGHEKSRQRLDKANKHREIRGHPDNLCSDFLSELKKIKH